MKKSLILALFIAAMLLATGCTQQAPLPSNLTLGERVKTSGCSIGVYPDAACTPGVINLSASTEDICTPGYTSQVRSVSESTKNAVYTEYGVKTHVTGEYEVDHFIPLELGGSNDIANLWPEPSNLTFGYHQKDKVENYLHDRVCSGKMSLPDAQRSIAYNWVTVFVQISTIT